MKILNSILFYTATKNQDRTLKQEVERLEKTTLLSYFKKFKIFYILSLFVNEFSNGTKQRINTEHHSFYHA